MKQLWEQINLGRHGVIEASAGTGKTYTIERLVVRLLREVPQLTIDQILIVTFTEKATSELRERVRDFLETSLRESPGTEEEEKRLQRAFNDFDTAQIFTIHGFCQRILAEYAFENGQLFDLELGSNREILRRLFHDQLRRAWSTHHLHELPEDTTLELAKKDYHESLILDLGNTLKPETPLLPKIYPEEQVREEFTSILNALRNCMRNAPDANFPERYQKHSLKKCGEWSGLSATKTEPIWKDLWELLKAPETQLSQVLNWYFGITYSRFTKGDSPLWSGFRALVPPDLRGDNCILPGEDLPELAELTGILEDQLAPLLRLANLADSAPELPVIQHSIRDLHAQLEHHKHEHGIITFDDMLLHVHKALNPANPGSAALLAALRRKYTFALVDEFQDTDPIQWDIFRRIFVEDAARQILYLVGDPKQAIYSFRGADVYTYLNAVRQISETFGEQCLYNLNTNFRSIPTLLDGLNLVFASDGWFPGSDRSPTENITYRPVEWPDDDIRRSRVFRDETRRSPLSLIHVNLPGSPEQRQNIQISKRRFAEFTVGEIKRLLAHPEMLSLSDSESGQPRNLKPSDICILVQKRSNVHVLETLLREQNIPYTFYKKSGIFQSDEARQLAFLFSALSDTDNDRGFRCARLTRFLSGKHQDILRSPSQSLHAHLEQWRELAQNRRWATLFKALLEGTGLAFREAAEPDGERRLANFRQLFQELLTVAAEGDADLIALRDFLNQQFEDEVETQKDIDIHEIETESPCVTIMTMHASKGLEFPIVFIADGFSDPESNRRDYIQYHQDGKRVVELKTNGDFFGKQQFQRERREEALRLYYVALTRARYKLYLPFGWNPPTKKTGKTPILPLLSPALNAFWEREIQNDHLACHLNTKGELIGTGFPSPQVDREPEHATTATTEPALPEAVDLLPALRLPPSVRHRVRHLDSYSSLAHGHGTHAPQSFGTDEYPENDERELPGKTETSLVPKGAGSGNVLHELLEKVDFQAIGNCENAEAVLAVPEFAQLLRTTMRRNSLANQERHDQLGNVYASTELELAELTRRALSTPLETDGFRLRQLDPSDCLAETEFHLAESEAILGPGADIAPERRQLLKGFIDLVFRRGDRYYILDWKSNTLETDYAPAELEQSMHESDYVLQYRIYTIALDQWLRRHLPDYSPDQNLGGVYYLYLRGLDGTTPDSGIYRQTIDSEKLASWKQQVNQALKNQG